MGTALKALQMLDLFSNSRPEIGLSQFARLSGHNKATVLRHLRALEEFGLVEQNPHSKTYAVGPAALRLASLREIARPNIESARQKMHEAMQKTGESLHLSLLEKGVLQTALVVETTKHSVRVSLNPGEAIPLNATASGMCILGYGPAELLEQIGKQPQHKFTETTLTDPDQILARVADVRDAGWACSKGSYEDGVFGFATPFFGIDQVAIGTIAVAIPETRATDDRRPAVLTELSSLSRDLTAIFGGQAPDSFPTAFH
ncbi:IclR family transcriptional regulator [uncultured Ruegeria sp.]|uniref:IclR family transcriptional regulator n=1 Tax=uncultured Ruegeria sp. TaxID=259304 RepID=UPI00260CA383|nr:IclR family transcriptional regulator [uncultured Ruegeria sp.]